MRSSRVKFPFSFDFMSDKGLHICIHIFEEEQALKQTRVSLVNLNAFTVYLSLLHLYPCLFPFV